MTGAEEAEGGGGDGLLVSAAKVKEIARKNAEIAKWKGELQSKDKEVTSLKERIAILEATLKCSKQIDVVDLTGDEAEGAKKRPRTEGNTKSSLAVLHKQHQNMVKDAFRWPVGHL